MFKWIKEILSYGSGEFSGNGALPPIRTPPLPMPKVLNRLKMYLSQYTQS